MGILRPTSNVRSEPVGNMTERFLRDFGILLSSSILTSNEVEEAEASRLPDLN